MTRSINDQRQSIWDAIRAAGRSVSRAELCASTALAPSTVANYLKGLTAAGILTRQEAQGGPVYTLVKDAGHHAPRVTTKGTPVRAGSGLRNMWRSMRMLKEFTLEDLALHSTTTEVAVSANHAKSYCAYMLAAGYLRVVRKAAPPTTTAIYRLIRNTGPRPPQTQRIHQIYDPNTDEIHLAGGRS